MTTVGTTFKGERRYTNDNNAQNKRPYNKIDLQSICINDKYYMNGAVMMRLCDTIGQMQGKPAQNYEYLAAVNYH